MHIIGFLEEYGEQLVAMIQAARDSYPTFTRRRNKETSWVRGSVIMLRVRNSLQSVKLMVGGYYYGIPFHTARNTNTQSNLKNMK